MVDNHRDVPAGAVRLSDLGLWQRFHARLTALYAVAVVLLVVVPMGVGFYFFAEAGEMRALQRRLLVTATALAAPINGDHVKMFRAPKDAHRPEYEAIAKALREACRVDRSIYSIYILVPTADPRVMNFAVDFESERALKEVLELEDPELGQPYKVARFPKLIAALKGPQVEDQLLFDDWTLSISGYAPVRDSAGNAVGVLGVDVDGKPVADAKRRVLWLTFAISVVGVFLFALGGVLVGRNIREPLEELIGATSQVAQGDLLQQLPTDRRDEFGVVSGHFNAMVTGLREREHIRATFGRYVSEDVAQALLANPESTALGGEVREVTVLFSDLRGYSTISEQLEPPEIVDLLNRYFGAMNKVLDRHNGVVIEFLGDAILAVFGAPQELPGHAEAAVKCAVQMRETLDQLNEQWSEAGLARRWQQVGLEALGQRVGIHTGPVVAGNLGSVERTKYAVIGDTVNLAARLEQLNKDVDSEGILISGETWAALGPALQGQCTFRESRLVKGRETEVAIHSV